MSWFMIVLAYLAVNALLLLFMRGADGGEERERPVEIPHRNSIDPEAGYSLCRTGECACGEDRR